MAGLEIKNVSSPDETRQLADKGTVGVVNVGGNAVLAGRWNPGWKWSEHVKPIVGTDSCEAPHLIYCVSGRMHVVMDDGTEGEVGPFDIVSIAPGPRRLGRGRRAVRRRRLRRLHPVRQTVGAVSPTARSAAPGSR